MRVFSEAEVDFCAIICLMDEKKDVNFWLQGLCDIVTKKF